MKNFILNPITIFFFVIISAFTLFIVFCTEKVTHRGVVLEHNISFNDHGKIYHYTIAKFDDGYTRSLYGFDYYIVPVGDTVYHSERVIKN